MTLEEQLTHFDNLSKHLRSILESKGNDYATEDRLSNFKDAAKSSGITPLQGCLNQLAIKVSRLGVLLKLDARDPANEPIKDTMYDLINYGYLLEMLYSDEKFPF